MSDLYAKLRAEAKQQPPSTTRDRYGNIVWQSDRGALPRCRQCGNPMSVARGDAVGTGLCFDCEEHTPEVGGASNGDAYPPGQEGLIAAFKDADNLGYVYSVETGEPVEPDHPDSPLVRAGVM